MCAMPDDAFIARLPLLRWLCNAINGWLTMVFVAYAYLLTIRLHFTYSMMVSMVEPLVVEPADRELCPDATINVGRNSTTVVTRRLLWTPGQQGVTMGAYFVGTLVSAFPGGVYANRDHERSMMFWCVAVTAVASALIPIALGRYESWPAVTFLRFIQGCAFGPTGPCGGTLAGKIVPKEGRTCRTTFMFSGTLFGGFFGHAFSALVIPYASHDGSFFVLSAIGGTWAVVWAAMVLAMVPYDRNNDGRRQSMMLATTPWSLIFRTMPFVSLLFASLGCGYLYSFITTAIPIYGAKVLGGDAVRNGLHVSVPWFICWVTSMFAGMSASLLTNYDTLTKTAVRKLYASIVLILSPLMLLGVMIANCDDSLAKIFMKLSVIFLGFERSSIRINSLDLCPSYVGSLMALCDVFYSAGNVMDSLVERNIFVNTFSWKASFLIAVILPMACSVLFLLFGTSQRQCWD